MCFLAGAARSPGGGIDRGRYPPPAAPRCCAATSPARGEVIKRRRGFLTSPLAGEVGTAPPFRVGGNPFPTPLAQPRLTSTDPGVPVGGERQIPVPGEARRVGVQVGAAARVDPAA